MHQGQTTESTALVLDVGGSREYRIEFCGNFRDVEFMKVVDSML